MNTLAKTDDTVQVSDLLTRLSSRIPSGPEGLAPAWQSDIELYRPHSVRSMTTTQRRILDDLYRYIQSGFNGGNQPVTGSGSTTSTIVSTGVRPRFPDRSRGVRLLLCPRQVSTA